MLLTEETRQIAIGVNIALLLGCVLLLYSKEKARKKQEEARKKRSSKKKEARKKQEELLCENNWRPWDTESKEEDFACFSDVSSDRFCPISSEWQRKELKKLIPLLTDEEIDKNVWRRTTRGEKCPIPPKWESRDKISYEKFYTNKYLEQADIFLKKAKNIELESGSDLSKQRQLEDDFSDFLSKGTEYLDQVRLKASEPWFDQSEQLQELDALHQQLHWFEIISIIGSL